MTTSTARDWSTTSWQEYPALQQPNWPDRAAYDAAIEELRLLPPLVVADEIRTLKGCLARACDGQAFLLQGGSCAEDFAKCTAPSIKGNLKILLQMAAIITVAGGKPVVKVGRIAGQYAKPRSSDTELVGGVELPSYRGDMVNSVEPSIEARRPNPRRMVHGYYRAATILNLLHRFTHGGFAALHRVHKWNQEFVRDSPAGEKFEQVARQIDQAIRLMQVIGLDMDNPVVNQAPFFTSHEALLLGYESALTRMDSEALISGADDGQWFDCSAHMLWIGDRTRQLDGAHVEFLRGVRNPIGMKVGPKHDVAEIVAIVRRLNPDNLKGRMTLITRFGAKAVADHLPGLIRAINREGLNVLWCCDPMHANTYTSTSGHKTRAFVDITTELTEFFRVHREEGSVAGGVHFELTGDDVTECVGGAREIVDAQLANAYETTCDPRLNAEQSLEMAFQIAEMIRG